MILGTKVFEEKIQPFLVYIGLIGAILSGIMYIAVTIVLILGFAAKSFTQAIVFALVTAVLGMVIFFFLRYQGISFAKALPENQKIVKEYNNQRPKNKRHSLTYFWIKTTLMDVIVKGATITLSTASIIYVVIEGSQDYKLLLLAAANLILFVCLGFVALSNAYDYYNEQYVPYMKAKIESRTKKETQNENTYDKHIKEPTEANLEV